MGKKRTPEKIAFKYQNKCGIPNCNNRFSTEKFIPSGCGVCPSCDAKGKSMRSIKENIVKEKKRIAQPELKFTIMKITIDQEKIKEFEFPENRRKIQNNQVESLTSALFKGMHFDTPIVINNRDGKMRLLDGNHRIEAISRVLKKDEKYEIEVWMARYDELDDDEENMIFKRWNVGRAQSTDDFIQSIAHKIDFLKWLRDDFPCEVKVYRQPNVMSVKLLCGAILSAKRCDIAGYGIRRRHFLEDMNELEKKDYLLAKKWVEEFIGIFGEPRNKNPYYSSTFFTAATYVRWQRPNIPMSRWKMALTDREIKETMMFSGREANKKMISLLEKKVGK